MTEGEPPLGLRERKKRETRAKLVKIAIRLAAERGLENVTVDDIAAEAGVSARTFFNYFPAKEDVILHADPDPIGQTRRIAAALLAAPAGLSPVRAVAHAMRPYIDEVDDDRDQWLARITIIERDPALMVRMFATHKESERILVDAVAERTGLDASGDFYPMLLFKVVGGAMQAATQRWHELGGSVRLAELFDAAIETIAAGLPVPVGTAVLEGKT
ncbi:TetR family transcriptional regulator [Kibdelosporangium persicum]|uniref:HTH-type transcriptional regulator BetI n=1 Tax=Kibdelosporangium persicum TaxID=2698649 RepID=A0ABX2F8G8_9PSEU|nr:TetR family transcriptional regulator [Kibdelosporangium persicum]NRN67641.1 HTH-type transcriptional regulator BetI [Kibdelosporangium persicum]